MTSPQHVQIYEELKTQVVAFSQSTGSPHTMAINPQLQADGILAIPLTWYSGWSDPAISPNLFADVRPYCIEAMNMHRVPDTSRPRRADDRHRIASPATTAATATQAPIGRGGPRAGDRLRRHRADHAAADKANPDRGRERDRRGRRPRVGDRSTRRRWRRSMARRLAVRVLRACGPAPPRTWNPALVGPDSRRPTPLSNDIYVSGVLRTVGRRVPKATRRCRDLVDARPVRDPLDYYAEGVIEATILDQACDRL